MNLMLSHDKSIITLPVQIFKDDKNQGHFEMLAWSAQSLKRYKVPDAFCQQMVERQEGAILVEARYVGKNKFILVQQRRKKDGEKQGFLEWLLFDAATG